MGIFIFFFLGGEWAGRGGGGENRQRQSSGLHYMPRKPRRKNKHTSDPPPRLDNSPLGLHHQQQEELTEPWHASPYSSSPSSRPRPTRSFPRPRDAVSFPFISFSGGGGSRRCVYLPVVGRRVGRIAPPPPRFVYAPPPQIIYMVCVRWFECFGRDGA